MPPKHTDPSPKHRAETAVAVKLDTDLKNRLEHLSIAKDRSTHWLMKQAIEQYVLSEEEAWNLKQETLRRWEEEALLNNTIPHTDIVEWLKTWNENGAKPPKWK
jgi:predicted transcriptional regulator